MIASHLFRCSRHQFLSKKFTLKSEQSKIVNYFAPYSFTNEKCYSKVSNNNSNSIVFKFTHPFVVNKQHLHIPPTNKVEFDEFLEAFKTELFKFSLIDLKASPKAHLTYGVGGLLPFVLPPLQMMLFGYTDGVAWLQLAYGATILSYLGGIQWGASIPDSSKSLPSWENLGLSVAPQLIAWISLTLPIPLGIITTSTALTATLAIDLLKHNYPPWFKSLRIFLTVGAVGSLFATLFGTIVA